MKPECKNCKYWVFTHVFLQEEKMWHCRDGFKPHDNKWGNCQDECARNDRVREEKNEQIQKENQ